MSISVFEQIDRMSIDLFAKREKKSTKDCFENEKFKRDWKIFNCIMLEVLVPKERWTSDLFKKLKSLVWKRVCLIALIGESKRIKDAEAIRQLDSLQVRITPCNQSIFIIFEQTRRRNAE